MLLDNRRGIGYSVFRYISKYYFQGGGTMAFAETFKALSDPVRRKILELLKEGPLSAGDIGSHFDMTGATISYHLKLLEQADLIFGRKEKNFIDYQLNTSVLEEIMLWISTLKGGGQDAENT